MTPFPSRRYNIIYADPPWAYRDKANAGRRGLRPVSVGHHAATAAGAGGDGRLGLCV